MIKFKNHAVGRVGLALTGAALALLLFVLGWLLAKNAETVRLITVISLCVLAADVLVFSLLTAFFPTVTVTKDRIEVTRGRKTVWRACAEDIEKITYSTYSTPLLVAFFLLAGDTASSATVEIKREAYPKYAKEAGAVINRNRARGTMEMFFVFYATKKQIAKIKALGYAIE